MSEQQRKRQKKRRKRPQAQQAQSPESRPQESTARRQVQETTSLRFTPDSIVRGLVMAEVLQRPRRFPPSSPALLGACGDAGAAPRQQHAALPASGTPCPRCGRTPPAGARYCHHCGAEQGDKPAS